MIAVDLERHVEPGLGIAAKSQQKISGSDVSQDFVRRVPIAFARRFGVLGLKAENGHLPVAVSVNDTVSGVDSVVSRNPLHALDKVATVLGITTRAVWVDEDVLRRAINEAYGQQQSGVEQVIETLPGADPVVLIDELSPSGDLLDTAGSSPVTKLVNLVLFEAVQRRASDVHVQPFEDLLQIRLRIDGVLYDYVCPPPHLLDEIVSRIKVMGKMNIAEKRLAQDGRTTVKVGDKTIDLRISTLPTSFGERVVLRLLDKSARLYRLPELGMSERDLVEFRGLITKTSGILLVTGPTGSGKSTTLYAALQELNCKELNVLTLEDPIEYQLSGISQTQVSDKKGMTFATGLRHVLRQDPDVIMVGEIRDQETARMAIQSSLTGHLVFSTLHTNDAAGAVARLLDLGVEPYLVSGSLLGVLAQRLVRRVCEHCRKPRPLTQSDVDQWQLPSHVVGSTVVEAIGCERCHQTGYRERMGIFELLRISEEVRELLHHEPQTRLLKEAARKAGMTTLHEDGVRKWLAGTTTLDEVCRVTTAESVS